MVFLTDKIWFPPVDTASPEGIVALGGDLTIPRLKLAYASGIFPWFNEGEPIVWYSPDPRMVLYPKDLKISKSLQQLLRKEKFKITFNTAFKQVISQCKTIHRPGQGGTWITDQMQQAYIKLYELGVAKSVEVWYEKQLVGGLYGVDLGSVFCGESMFSTISDASKVAFVALVQKLRTANYKLIDCQVYTPHLASLGAVEISRNEFLKYL